MQRYFTKLLKFQRQKTLIVTKECFDSIIGYRENKRKSKRFHGLGVYLILNTFFDLFKNEK